MGLYDAWMGPYASRIRPRAVWEDPERNRPCGSERELVQGHRLQPWPGHLLQPPRGQLRLVVW